MNTKIILLFLLTCLGYYGAWAQQSVLEYNNAIIHELNSVITATAAYVDAATHGRNAADANAKLATMVKTLEKAKSNVAAIPPYKGYTGLRDSIVSYLSLAYKAAAGFSGVLGNEEMLALPFEKAKTYMDVSDQLNDKLSACTTQIKLQQRHFAEKYGFSIDDDPKPLDKKFKDAKLEFRYYHRVFLVFFKCNKQEQAFIDTLNSGSPKSVEVIRKLFQQYTEDGLRKLDTFSAFNNDAGLVKASKEALLFFESEAKDKFPIIVDYLQKKDKFDKQSAAVENIPPKDRTDKMIDSYNANLKTLNEAVNNYNSTNNELNAKRMEVLDKYNKAIADFLDRNTPKMK